MSGEPISRRRALGLLGLGTAGVAAGAAGWATGLGAPPSSRLKPAAQGQGLAEPRVLASRDGLLDVRLVAAPGVRLAGRDTTGWGFNGTSPGPTLRVRPGDLLRVRLVNHIDQPTNLHTHGMHVSPSGNSDNPFITIEPGDSFDYAIRIPARHPAGTFWYHPHHHGTVADQIFAGLVGALLVDGVGGKADLPVDGDRLLLVTDTTLDGAGRVASPTRMARMMGREGELVLVNGQHQPVITAAPGSVQRWRVINGCVSRVLALRLDSHRLTQLALDGALLPAPVDRDQVVLAPGNRADLLVRPTGSGQYALVSDPYDRGSLGMMGGMMDGGPSASGPVTLVTLATAGPATTSPSVPATLSAPAVPQGPVTRQRRLTFAMGMGRMGMGGMGFTIDERTFDPDRDDQNVALGTVEEWTVVNTSPMDHPFHLHAWPFHVLAGSTGMPPAGVLQDVVLVPARGWVRLRIPFSDFAGRSVFHCHILDHEDLGMMATVNVRG
ncbi:multicopper oxidase family protein [Streptomyces sp. NBC_01549]|uniref:multicopper oxidase family protein n=1 Tax=Streptomyces sp. NBC_01549 TaxID=2975874 RepID=UPI00224DBA6A|nr:multicopper oxidase family protein [Streptomyces sp. NBC_01549]MCX4594974.1 multicopper oxidase family protein [Streptomyces sp. NBC_01549]